MWYFITYTDPDSDKSLALMFFYYIELLFKSQIVHVVKNENLKVSFGLCLLCALF